ncbi:hypothetical protein DEF28_07950 [Marinitenerispora sediminis]|uniref:Right handed beta helix domain-containing protein n=2 Tax=Marinitenerispora sediminis TaxID=1931232 RepID=A0A368T9D1_9ACTN|nr:hypothetical protein DEF28_07950 [Marinitenerispora sediminis]RCV61159.1 hypothetical protein DEF24_04825 [Marinitenerispora sediminis]
MLMAPAVEASSDIRIAARTEFATTSDITLQNLRATDSAINESPCGVRITLRSNTLVNSRLNVCSGSAGAGR